MTTLLISPALQRCAVALHPSSAPTIPLLMVTPLSLREPASSATPQGPPRHPLNTFHSYSGYLAIPYLGTLLFTPDLSGPACRPGRSPGQVTLGSGATHYTTSGHTRIQVCQPLLSSQEPREAAVSWASQGSSLTAYHLGTPQNLRGRAPSLCRNNDAGGAD